jgi:hypothetical protein
MKTLIRIRIQNGKVEGSFFVKTVPSSLFPGNSNIGWNLHSYAGGMEIPAGVRSSWRGVRGGPSYKKVLPDFPVLNANG